MAIARVLLKPRWVFADEATSALDAPPSQAVYDKLSALVQRRNGALVSIATGPAWPLSTPGSGHWKNGRKGKRRYIRFGQRR